MRRCTVGTWCTSWYMSRIFSDASSEISYMPLGRVGASSVTGSVSLGPYSPRVPLRTTIALGFVLRTASIKATVPLMLMSMSGYGSLRLLTCETCAARWNTTSWPSTINDISCSSRTSQKFTRTWSRTGSTLNGLPPYSGIMASAIVTTAPAFARRMASVEPMKPSPPVTSTRLPRQAASRLETSVTPPSASRARHVGRRPQQASRFVERNVAGRRRDRQRHERARAADQGQARPRRDTLRGGQRAIEAEAGCGARGERERRHEIRRDHHAPPRPAQLARESPQEQRAADRVPGGERDQHADEAEARQKDEAQHEVDRERCGRVLRLDLGLADAAHDRRADAARQRGGRGHGEATQRERGRAVAGPEPHQVQAIGAADEPGQHDGGRRQHVAAAALVEGAEARRVRGGVQGRRRRHQRQQQDLRERRSRGGDAKPQLVRRHRAERHEAHEQKLVDLLVEHAEHVVDLDGSAEAQRFAPTRAR